MKIIDNFENDFYCRIGSPLIGIKLKKVYFWEHEKAEIKNSFDKDFDEYVEHVIMPKFVGAPIIKFNKKRENEE